MYTRIFTIFTLSAIQIISASNLTMVISQDFPELHSQREYRIGLRQEFIDLKEAKNPKYIHLSSQLTNQRRRSVSRQVALSGLYDLHETAIQRISKYAVEKPTRELTVYKNKLIRSQQLWHLEDFARLINHSLQYIVHGSKQESLGSRSNISGYLEQYKNHLKKIKDSESFNCASKKCKQFIDKAEQQQENVARDFEAIITLEKELEKGLACFNTASLRYKGGALPVYIKELAVEKALICLKILVNSDKKYSEIQLIKELGVAQSKDVKEIISQALKYASNGPKLSHKKLAALHECAVDEYKKFYSKI